MLRKITFVMALLVATVFSVTTFAAPQGSIKENSIQVATTKVNGAYPTNIYVYNWMTRRDGSVDPYDVVNVYTPDYRSYPTTIYPHPYTPYFAHIFDDRYYHYQVYVVLTDRYNREFLRGYVVNGDKIDVYPSAVAGGLPTAKFAKN